MNIAYFIGTRPEVIRSSRILRLLASTGSVKLSIINSGQHYDEKMMGSFLRELDIPDCMINLNVGSSDRANQVAAIFSKTAQVLARERPSCLCVFGDTNSSLGAGLAATASGVPLVHIEAGCRSNDMAMPEEINRRLIDHMSGLLLAVSDLSAATLVSEMVPGVIQRVGDPLFDVFVEAAGPRPDRSVSRAGWTARIAKKESGIVTLHRAENVDDPGRLKVILDSLEEAARRNGINWLFPVHPRTTPSLPTGAFEHIRYLEPMGYKELLGTLARSTICVTDSGGLQKEALWSSVPCVTVRKSTEWVETIVQRCNTLCEPGPALVSAVAAGLDTSIDRDFSDPYGSADAATETVAAIMQWLEAGASFRVSPGATLPSVAQ